MIRTVEDEEHARAEYNRIRIDEVHCMDQEQFRLEDRREGFEQGYAEGLKLA
jgi:hypothetical protein